MYGSASSTYASNNIGPAARVAHARERMCVLRVYLGYCQLQHTINTNTDQSEWGQHHQYLVIKGGINAVKECING